VLREQHFARVWPTIEVMSSRRRLKELAKMRQDQHLADIVVAECSTEAAASAALKTLKGQLSLKDAAIVRNENGKVKSKLSSLILAVTLRRPAAPLHQCHP
jgi:hypothetical protein